MLISQSIVKVKDNTKILKVKIMNSYEKKNMKFKDPFLGVMKTSKHTALKLGTMQHFMTVSTSKKSQFPSGKTKCSDNNFCVAIKNSKSKEPIGSSFLGFFYSELKSFKNQKYKNLLNQCI